MCDNIQLVRCDKKLTQRKVRNDITNEPLDNQMNWVIIRVVRGYKEDWISVFTGYKSVLNRYRPVTALISFCEHYNCIVGDSDFSNL